jgi:phage regulator Rha-like protein
MNGNIEILIPDEVIVSKIYQFRENKVMLDMDLAEMYGVETKQLKRAVRRNLKRFPPDFMFELSQMELENLRSQFGTSSWGGLRYPPMAFTEQGIAMLSSILNSDRAIMVNIRIIRIFVKMRELLLNQKDIIAQLKEIAQKVENHDENIHLIFVFLNQLEQDRQQQYDQANRKKIGFRQDGG